MPTRVFDATGNPTYCDYDGMTLPKGFSVAPFFPGYTFENGKSMYRGEDVGNGGYVYSEPGMYGNVALLDVASMHPSSVIAETLFGIEYTARFKEIVQARIAIKHGDYDKAKTMLGGKLAAYLEDGKYSSEDLANALKTAINSVYGLTSAKFDNAFRDKRNIDNIVAKRGALFMVNLKHAVWDKGYRVAHIKTDSIKIPDADNDIIKFIMDYGKEYGYTFEHEATYDRMCLVNDAVYIAKYDTAESSMAKYGYIPKDCKKYSGKWTATGEQFAVPYVFKKLFTHKDIGFNDMCETKSVSTALYLGFNEDNTDGWHECRFIGKVGRFCPMKEGCGGGTLLRETLNAKTGEKGYSAANGSTGFFWMEAETVKALGKEADIDRSYYDKQVDKAIDAISELGDYWWFVSDYDPYIPVEHPEDRAPWN